jgi:hypothetical protein
MGYSRVLEEMSERVVGAAGAREKVAAAFKPAISNVPDYAHDGVSGNLLFFDGEKKTRITPRDQRFKARLFLRRF